MDFTKGVFIPIESFKDLKIGDIVKCQNFRGRNEIFIGIVILINHDEIFVDYEYANPSGHKGGRWTIVEYVKKYVEEPEDDEEFENDPEVYEEYNYKKNHFEVGDEVVIRNDLREMKNGKRFYVNRFMLDLIGRKAKITEVLYDERLDLFYYKINISNPFISWEDFMFEPIEKEDDSEFEEGFDLDEGYIKKYKNFIK